MSNVIQMPVYIIISDCNKSNYKEYYEVFDSLGPNVRIMDGSWLISTAMNPGSIVAKLSRIERGVNLFVIHVKKRKEIEDSFSSYSGNADLIEWIHNYLT